jgi:tRNA C32,U32 (ribose-2'-O)-methylase TrmJ
MNLRVVLVEPIYDGNIGSVACSMKDCSMKDFAVYFQDAAPIPILKLRPAYYGKRANVISKHEAKMEDELACQTRGFPVSSGKV